MTFLFSQLIITGDFFQLPPVPDRHDGTLLPVTFAFDAMMWDTCIQKEYTLTKVFRQEDEGIYSYSFKLVPYTEPAFYTNSFRQHAKRHEIWRHQRKQRSAFHGPLTRGSVRGRARTH